MHDAADRKVRPSRRTYHSNREFKVTYDHLCAEYQRPHDHFGRDARSTMKGLTRIKHGAERAQPLHPRRTPCDRKLFA